MGARSFFFQRISNIRYHSMLLVLVNLVIKGKTIHHVI